MFVVTLPPEERSALVNQALEDLKMSLKGHTSLSALASREQLYEFTCALYQSVIAFCLLATPKAILIGTEIEKYCMVIYEYYSASTGLLTLEEDPVKAIHEAFRLLELPLLSYHASGKNALVDLPAYDYQYPTLQGAVVSPNQIGSQVVSPPNQDGAKAPRTRFRTRANRNDTEFTAGKIESMEQKAHQDERDITVADPFATTLLPSISGSSVSDPTNVPAPVLVDPQADTQESEQHPVTEIDPEAPIQPTSKAGELHERNILVGAPPVSPDADSSSHSNDVVEQAEGPSDLGRGQEVAAVGDDGCVVADDVGVEDASVDTGYSGSVHRSTNPDPGDSFLNSDPAVEAEEYVESVLPQHRDVDPALLPQKFLRSDPANPISSFVDSSVPALSGQTVDPEAHVEISKISPGQDLILKTAKLILEPLSVHRKYWVS
jgi:hypothetical protein